VLKVFLLRLGVGGGKIFFSGKNFRSRFGSVQQRRDMFSGWDFLRLNILLLRSGSERRFGSMFSGRDFLRMSILLFKAGRCVRGASVGIY